MSVTAQFQRSIWTQQVLYNCILHIQYTRRTNTPVSSLRTRITIFPDSAACNVYATIVMSASSCANPASTRLSIDMSSPRLNEDNTRANSIVRQAALDALSDDRNGTSVWPDDVIEQLLRVDDDDVGRWSNTVEHQGDWQAHTYFPSAGSRTRRR